MGGKFLTVWKIPMLVVLPGYPLWPAAQIDARAQERHYPPVNDRFDHYCIVRVQRTGRRRGPSGSLLCPCFGHHIFLLSSTSSVRCSSSSGRLVIPKA